jgi:para-nitrobenzyl esterase
MYERIELSGDAANSAKSVVATFEISGVKQGPADSKMTFSVQGMQSGMIKVTMSVNGQLAFDDTVTVGRPTAQTGSISVTSVPSGADISVDGVYAGKTPLVIRRVATGVRTVLISKQGYAPFEREVKVRQNDIIAVSETLVKNTGTLRVISLPSRATVLVQKVSGNSGMSQSDTLTPATYKYLEPGLYYVMVSRTNCTSQTKIVTVVAGKTTVASLSVDCTHKEPNPGVVKTDAGYVSGIEENGLWVYLGIPFAAPPTEDLRWRPPAPVQPWGGVKETKVYSAAPPQPPSPGVPTPIMSEDCLYLNVWTPAKRADEKLPVMVFFYGGAFGQIAPYGTMAVYNGTTLARKGVIIVTANYRLGALGFLAHPQLDSESHYNSSGNYGILDQIAALQWVQRNIAAFGGDPSRLTIFGQSAGGESVLIHLVSPQSRGLYSQAIVESGPFWANGPTIHSVHSKVDAEQFGETYATSLGCFGPDVTAQMRRVSVGDLINATPWPSSSWQLTHNLHFEPTIDGWILPDSVDALFALHRENPVPLMIGTNANDGTTLSANANMTAPEYIQFIHEQFGPDAKAVLAQYPANSTQEVQLRLAQIMTHYDFSDAAKFAAGSMADLNPNTYLYRYSYVLPNQPNGAFHGSETLLLFNLPGINADPEVSANLVDLWTRFGKTGDPNGAVNVTWPQYTREVDQYLNINITSTVKSGY